MAVQALLAVQVAQCLEDGVDFWPSQPRAGRHAELSLDIVGRVEQHTARRFPVTSGPARFLYIVFQRTRDIGMNDQAHIRLVDAHTEGVGGDDHPEATTDELLLYVFLGFWRQASVEVGGVDVFGAEILSDIFGLGACRTVDDSAAGRVRRQVRGQDLVDMGEFLAARRRYNHEFQVGTLRAAVKDGQVYVELVTKVGVNVFPYLGLGRCCQADYLSVGCLLANKASYVAVVGPEVVAPA